MLSFSIFLRYFLRGNKKNQEANVRVPTLKSKVGSRERIRCRESRRMRKLDKVCGRFLRDVDVEELIKDCSLSSRSAPVRDVTADMTYRYAANSLITHQPEQARCYRMMESR